MTVLDTTSMLPAPGWYAKTVAWFFGFVVFFSCVDFLGAAYSIFVDYQTITEVNVVFAGLFLMSGGIPLLVGWLSFTYRRDRPTWSLIGTVLSLLISLLPIVVGFIFFVFIWVTFGT